MKFSLSGILGYKMLKSSVAVMLLLAAVSQGALELREYNAVSVTGCLSCWRVNRALVTTCRLQSALGAVCPVGVSTELL